MDREQREGGQLAQLLPLPNSLLLKRSWGIDRRQYEMLAARTLSARFATDVWRARGYWRWGDGLEMRMGDQEAFSLGLLNKD